MIVGVTVCPPEGAAVHVLIDNHARPHSRGLVTSQCVGAGAIMCGSYAERAAGWSPTAGLPGSRRASRSRPVHQQVRKSTEQDIVQCPAYPTSCMHSLSVADDTTFLLRLTNALRLKSA